MQIDRAREKPHRSVPRRNAHAFTHRGLRNILCILILSSLTSVTLAQQPRRIEGGGQRGNREGRQIREERRGPDQHPHAPGFFRRLRELSPDEQERVMANDERFQRLPPERQAAIRRNLERWNSLTPRQKEQVRERQEILESLSPAQRREARALFPAYNRLPPERKQAVRQAFLHARDLPPRQREQYLTSSEVMDRFSPPEERLLRGLTRLLPDSRRAAADEPDPEH